MSKVKEKYFMTKYRPAGILLNINAMIYFKFKLQLIEFRYNKNFFNCKFPYSFTLKKYTNIQIKFRTKKLYEKRTADWYTVTSLLLNLLKPAGYVIHQQFNIQQLYVLPTLYLCVLHLSENKQRLVPLTA